MPARALLTTLLSVGTGCTEPHFLTDAGDAQEAEGVDATLEPAPTYTGSDAAHEAEGSEVEGSDAEPPARDATSCSGAACASDAAGTALPDAGSQLSADAQGPDLSPEGGLDPVRALWAGRYAARSFVFSFDNPVRTSGVYLTLAKIRPSAEGGLVLEEELCSFESRFSLGLTAHLRENYPPGTRLSAAALTFDSEHFSSAAASAQIGYTTPPPGCVPGAPYPVQETTRGWLTNNTCDCPVDERGPPTNARDCRVIDSDGDGQPGNTFEVSLDTAKGVFRATQEQHLRLLNGYRANGRLYAQREAEDITKVLSCTIDGRATRIEDCPLGTVGPCPPSFHSVELVPIEAAYDCDDIIEREQGWFSPQRPEFPAACPAQLSMN